jgi:ABC-type sugar transport system permease subunit
MFVLPWVIGFLAFMAVPLIRSFRYSLSNLEVKTTGLQAHYIGLENFRKAFTVDVEFTPKLMATVSGLIFNVPLILIFAMFTALLLNRNFKGRMIFRGIFFLPVIIASGTVLTKLRQDGAANLPIFKQYDLASTLSNIMPSDLVRPLLGMLESLSLSMWDSGVQILIFLAGLQSISSHLYEAAKVDGATPWEIFWKVTFPIIMPMILVNTLFSIVNSFTKVGNPIMEYIMSVLFEKNDFGYGAALGWIYFLITFVIIGIVLYLFRKSLRERG